MSSCEDFAEVHQLNRLLSFRFRQLLCCFCSCLLLFSHKNRFWDELVLDETGIGMKVVLDEIYTFGMKVVLDELVFCRHGADDVFRTRLCGGLRS